MPFSMGVIGLSVLGSTQNIVDFVHKKSILFNGGARHIPIPVLGSKIVVFCTKRADQLSHQK